jgi:hypothetical protein
MPQGVYTFLQDGLRFILDSSNTLQFQLITYSIDEGDYDDSIVVGGSSVSYASGLIFPITNKMGSDEQVLLEQGKITNRDKKVYILGSNLITTSGLIVGLGSPSTEYFKVINDGVTEFEINGSPVYKKMFLRHSNTGSVY